MEEALDARRVWVARVNDIPEVGAHVVSVDDIEIGLFRVRDRFVAWRNVCPHFAAPVCRGKIAGTTLPSAVYEYEFGREGEILQCPWHGWEFDLLSGQHLVENSRARLKQYTLDVRGGDVFLVR